MDSEWKLLIQIGLPQGAVRATRGQISDKAAAIRHAVGSLAAQDLDPTETDLLAAWLSGFRHHWPSAFAQVLGQVGELSLQTLMPKVEPNRYLKLRRIAIANLANLL